MDILKETNFDFLGEKKTGKVRDIYLQPARIVLVATDRHSSFDRIIAHIPHKGQVLNQISAYWMKHLESVVPNHILAIPDPNVTVAKKCQPIAVEAVVRKKGYVSGVAGGSLLDRETGFRDLGYGLDIVDWLMEPGSERCGDWSC